MAANAQRPHLTVDAFREAERFRPRSTPRQVAKVKGRQRTKHGEALLQQLTALSSVATDAVRMQQELSNEVPNGIYLTFESEPGFDLKLDSLDRVSDGIELLAVQAKGKRTLATAFVPEGKLPVLERLVEQYLNKDNVNRNTGKKTPRHRELIQNIRSIRRAALNQLWTDHPDLLPTSDAEVIWWEVWLRTEPQREALTKLFRKHAAAIGLTLSRTELWFPDRTILAARGTRAQLLQSVFLLNCIAELRRLQEPADFFTGLKPSEQWQWTDDLVGRVVFGDAQSPAVCVLDTGMSLHPLIAPALAEQGLHAVNPDWGTHDAFGHGTQMGGLALYGDLCEVLPANGPIELKHRLESVKILRHNGDNEGELYGAITREGIARAEEAAPHRDRIFCMAIASKEHRDQGRPSAWSAALDRLISGAEDGEKRLIVVSAGNVLEADHGDYPSANTVDGIHEPGQSWNALTVGGVTFKDSIDPEQYPDYQLLAPVGGLSPYSCSAGTWAKDWPIKPDVVFEGGNRARRPDGDTDSLRSLDLLSLHHLHEQRAFDSFWGTSAAAALGSKLACQIKANYTSYWPETVRGLIVHSARWTPSMMSAFAPNPERKRDVNNLLRHCGYGVPSLQRALWSAGNALTLVAQQELQPFEAVRSRTGRVQRVRSRDMHIYALPWPIEELLKLGDTKVEMRVALSYFVEPNPSERGWTRRYRYESHGLRFAVKKVLESEQAFRTRIADYAHAEEEGMVVGGQDAGWVVGPNLRHHGSIHADIWAGRASELAERGAIAVYPTLGWWRERLAHEKYEDPVRYSLIVSIDTEDVAVDLYTPVAKAIESQIAVEV